MEEAARLKNILSPTPFLPEKYPITPSLCIQVMALFAVALETFNKSHSTDQAFSRFPSLTSASNRKTPSRSQYVAGAFIRRRYILLISGVIPSASEDVIVSIISLSIWWKFLRYSLAESWVLRMKR